MSTIIADRYELGPSIGIGGMAEVFVANDRLLNRRVAVKILNRAYAEQPEFVERFRREARAAAALDHPNIVPIYDWGETGDSYFIVMAYVPGETLMDLLRSGGPLPESEALSILSEVAGALGAAHALGIVHRDIKPHNILLDETGQSRVTDFGIAQAAGLSSLTETSVVLGTATYISPEQASRGQIDARSDIYSLGIVAYEMLAGRPPFRGQSIVELAVQHVNEPPPPLRTVRPDISLAAEHVVMTCIEKRPEDRFQSAEDLKFAIAGAVESPEKAASEAETAAMAAGPSTPVEQSGRPGRASSPPRLTGTAPNRARILWAGIAVAAIALVAVLALILSQLEDLGSPDLAGPSADQNEIVAPQPTEPVQETERDPDQSGEGETENASTDAEVEDPSEDSPADGEAPEESVTQNAPDAEVQQVPGGSGTFTCDGEFAGGSAGSLIVPGNATCVLNGVRVEDDVAVQPGAVLQATDVEIYGNVEARSAAGVEILGSSYVDGNIEFRQSGALTIGGATVNGNVIAEQNSAAITIDGSSIDGNMEVESNSGGVSITGNFVDGDIECEGNDPPPTGGGNFANGSLEGQCSGL